MVIIEVDAVRLLLLILAVWINSPFTSLCINLSTSGEKKIDFEHKTKIPLLNTF